MRSLSIFMTSISTLTMNPCVDKSVSIDRVDPNRKLLKPFR